MDNAERLRLVHEAYNDLLTYLYGAFEFCENMKCTKCRCMTSTQLRFWTPRLGTKMLDEETKLITLVAWRHALILLDGHCAECGYSIYAMFSRIDRELEIDPAAAKDVPEMRRDQKCAACRDLGVRGFFRRGICTNGICVKCGRLIGPKLLLEDFQLAMHRVVGWMDALRYQEQNLKTLLPSEEIKAPLPSEEEILVDDEDITEIELDGFEEITIKDFDDSDFNHS